MAKLALCFSEEEKKYHPPTKYEVNEISIAAQGVSAIIHAMQFYANNNRNEEDEGQGVYGCVFTALEWLMAPVTDYLFNFAGDEAAPENKAIEIEDDFEKF